MALNLERHNQRVTIQSKGMSEEIDFYRIEDNVTKRQETLNLKGAGIALQERTRDVLSRIGDAEKNLILDSTIAAITCLEAIRRRSKVLMLVSLAAGVGAVNANRQRNGHFQELGWLDKESMALEGHEDERDSRPTLILVKQQP